MRDYDIFKDQVYRLTGIDLNSYKETQMKRRIDQLIARHGLSGYDDFVTNLKSNSTLLKDFLNYLTINVSEFYRNPDQWSIVRSRIVPLLINTFGPDLKIWSAACSTGDEPYTLVFVLSDNIPMNRIRITATDIDDLVLKTAQEGIYSEKSFPALPKEYKDKYFIKREDKYEVLPEVKRCVDFKQHNLLADPYPSNLHMIVCRNVLIYFTEETKEQIFRKYYHALAPGGILFLGSTEQMMSYKDVGFERLDSFFFRKPL